MEASMIIPLIIFLFSFLIYLTFFLYNRCIASQDAYILAFRGSLCCGESKEDIKKYVMNRAREQTGEKYMALTELNHTVYAGNASVEVEIKGNQLKLRSIWQLQESAKADRICPVKIIRGIRLAGKIGEKIQND